jgi:uncharacterized protein (TIGR02679 family)
LTGKNVGEPDDRVDRDRLSRLLGGELTWLVERVRKRLERGESLDTSVTLTSATQEQRDAVHRLLGRRPRAGAALTVALPAVDEILRRSGASPDGLAAAVTALTGPITDRAARAATLDAAWRRAFAPLTAVAGSRAELAEWYARLHATGLVRRLTSTPETAGPLLADLARVVADLPSSGEPLSTFAARTAHDAHALDDGRPLATLALGAARVLAGLPEAPSREVWASVGVVRDDVSSTVLTLGFPGDAHTATGRALAAFHAVGQPVVLTLRQLVGAPPRLPTGPIAICENPVVVTTAADRLGPACPPLVCTHGQPGAAVMHLLRTLAETGADLRFHGDFDWGGVRIGNVLFDRLPIHPWRFDAPTYRTVVAAHPGTALAGTPVAATWDPHLAPAMTELATKVEEERLLDTLVQDLAAD